MTDENKPRNFKDVFSKKYLLHSPMRTILWVRVVAKSIDLILALLLSGLFFPFGVILGVFYLAVCDSLSDGQSIGKRFVGMAVLSLKDGGPCSVKQSCIRNLPFFVALLHFLIPFWGHYWGLFALGVFCFGELYFLLKLKSGHRFGDVMADTTVIADDPFREDIQKEKRRRGLESFEEILPAPPTTKSELTD